MSLKQQILQELQNPNFPNLKFFYSPEVLELAPEILQELLEAEKLDFEKKLHTPDIEINFDTFEEFSELSYFFELLEHYQGVNNDDDIRKIIEEFEPKLIAFGNEIAYSKKYYDMLVHCFKNCILDSEQKRILEQSIEAYQVRGIALPKEKQEELKRINLELSELTQTFGNNVLDSQKAFSYIITDVNIISEMPEDDRKVAQKKAQEKGKTGFLFDASGNAYSSIMKYCVDEQVRKYFYEARNTFATEDKHNNKKVILEILDLRHRKAKLLGFANYAELSLRFKMAENSEQILELFSSISGKAKIKAHKEIEEIESYFGLKKIRVWDMSYYARKLREEKYALDDRELKKYFEFEKVLAGMFQIVKKLYNLDIQEIEQETYDREVKIYEVSRNGEFLSYFFTDYFYRPLKRHGAWANILRENYNPPITSDTPLIKGDGGGFKKIVVNVGNFQKGEDGRTLLTLSDIETMFHEFGHATHEMMSISEHSELSGFHVEWDFVELPSQLLENWCRHRDGLDMFARHIDSGEKIPEEMLQTLETLETFGTGNMIVKQNEYAMMDMFLHSSEIPKDEHDLDIKIHDIYTKNAIFPRPDIYNPHTSFTHIFDGGYAAGYYSYMWAEILEKEVWQTFLDSGNIFSPEVAQKLHDTILSQGTRKDATELFMDFMGRDVNIEAFLKEKGL